MTLLLQRTAFIHVQKTGGTYVRHAVRQLHLKEREAAVKKNTRFSQLVHRSYRVDKIYIGPRIAWGLVRQPLSWLKSYYAYRTKNGWGQKGIDSLPHGDINVWIYNVEKHYPGTVSELYTDMLKGCDYIGRTEELPEPLLFVLSNYERVPQFKLNQLKRIAPQNVTDSHKLVVEPSIVRLVAIKEKVAQRYWDKKEVR